ncbi:MAG: Rid family detoxifying hydrolase [Fidelibacterota bacterium]
MEKRVINTHLAPAPIGAYNQAIVSNGFIFTAGQVPIDPMSGEFIKGEFKQRVDQVLHNLNAILSAAGSDLGKVVKFTVFLTDLSNYSDINAVFDQRFKGEEPPARSLVEVSKLPGGTDIEIECIATL